MPDFNYIARDEAGQKVSGTLTAGSRGEALALLGTRELFPVEVRDASPVADGEKLRRVPAQLLATTYGQMADLLRSGVPILRTIDVLRQQTSHGALSAVLERIHHHVEQGATLAEAMARFPRVFDEMSVSMIRAGNEGGFLEEALARVAQFTEAQEDFRKRTIGAVAYPVLLSVLGTIVVVVLMVFFVPRFGNLFESLRQRGELPILTGWLLAVSALMRRWFVVALAVLVGAAWFFKRWLASEPGRYWRDRTKLRLPLVGGIFQSLAVARFCRVLGTLLKNGVPILRGLEISSDATANRVLSEAIQKATENISAGQSLAGPLAASGHFPPMVVEMISVAEEANNLEVVLLDVADSLETRTWRRLDLAVRLLEPILLTMIAGVVLLLAIALLLPVLKMSQMV
ncbi:MAG: type II secretion system F family protein [Pirellulales bacterium]|nr:type II secretion system F family protein [Pirellulales bacterium]